MSIALNFACFGHFLVLMVNFSEILSCYVKVFCQYLHILENSQYVCLCILVLLLDFFSVARCLFHKIKQPLRNFNFRKSLHSFDLLETINSSCYPALILEIGEFFVVRLSYKLKEKVIVD